MEVISRGVFSTATLAPTLNACFKIGSTAFCSSASSLVSSAANYRIAFDLILTCVSVTANVCTGYISGGGMYSQGLGLSVASLDITNAGASTTWATNAPVTLDLTGGWGTASVSNTIKTTNLVIRELN